MNRRDLQALAEKELEKQQQYKCRLLCCGSTPCLSSGGTAVQERLKNYLKANKELRADLAVVSTGCMGPCSRGPLITVQTQDEADVIYENVTPDMAEKIVQKHCLAVDTPELEKQFYLTTSPSLPNKRR
jgi:bidirectional [NiFe] hydrogenase diaphorase subunit